MATRAVDGTLEHVLSPGTLVDAANETQPCDVAIDELRGLATQLLLGREVATMGQPVHEELLRTVRTLIREVDEAKDVGMVPVFEIDRALEKASATGESEHRVNLVGNSHREKLDPAGDVIGAHP